MWPWRVNQSYERNLDGTLEAKPSLVMHMFINEAGHAFACSYA